MDALQRASLAMTAFSAGTRTVRMAWLRSLVCGDANGQDGLVALEPGSGSDGLSESLAHSTGHTVRSCAGSQLVLPQDDVGVRPDGHVVVGDADLSVQDLVGGDTSGLDGGVPDLDAVLHPEGEDDGEVLPEVSHLVLGDPACGDSSHVFAACVRLAFDLPVHRCWLSYHLNHLG